MFGDVLVVVQELSNADVAYAFSGGIPRSDEACLRYIVRAESETDW
jgi:hypothetical protein